MTPDIQKIQVATANELLEESKILGNISMIDRAADLVYFCPAGVSFTPKNVIAIPFDYRLIEDGDSVYPEEWLFHFAIYRRYPKAVSVAFAQPMYGSAFANVGKDVCVYEKKYASVFPRGIPCIHIDRAISGGKLNAAAIDNRILDLKDLTCSDEHGALLVYQNGMLVWDITPQKAYERTLKAAECAESAFFTTQMGEAKALPPELAEYYFEKRIEKENCQSHGLPGFPVTEEERKKISLEMLVYFDRVCRDNGVHYSITGGTLLGAVRHGGFIPWDDDVDVFMTRPEYEKIRELLPDNERFVLLDRRKKPDYDFVYGRLIDTETIITESPGTLNAGTGVFLDICIVDGLPNNKLLCKLHIKHMWILTRLRLASRRSGSIQEPSTLTYKKHGRLGGRLRLIGARILRKFTTQNYWNSRMEKIISRYPFENATYVGNFATQYGKKEKLEKKVFDSYIDIDFEGYQVMACEGYEKYLVSIYGDYTKLPVNEKRKGHHPGILYWI